MNMGALLLFYISYNHRTQNFSCVSESKSYFLSLCQQQMFRNFLLLISKLPGQCLSSQYANGLCLPSHHVSELQSIHNYQEELQRNYCTDQITYEFLARGEEQGARAPPRFFYPFQKHCLV
jgi:hypothetical protein